MEDSHLFPCGYIKLPRYCRLHVPVLHRSTKWPFFAHKGTFSICLKLQLQRVVILEMPHLTNTMTNMHWHNVVCENKVMHFLSKTWPSASSLCCRAVYDILSLSSMSPLHLTEVETWRSLSRRQRAIRLHLRKHMSFKHFRYPMSLWLTNTGVKVFSLGEDGCSPVALLPDTPCTAPATGIIKWKGCWVTCNDVKPHQWRVPTSQRFLSHLQFYLFKVAVVQNTVCN